MPCCEEEATDTCDSQPLVIIIGAGLAGLAAASKLLDLGYKNLRVIEASEHIGGRIENFKFESDHVLSFELGAQWLHGEKGNPIYEWLSERDLINAVEDEEIEMKGLFRTQLGESLKPDMLVERCLEILLNTRHQLYKMSKNLNATCSPIHIYRDQLYSNISMDSKFKSVDKDVLESILQWYLLYETIDNSCEHISKLSIRAYSGWTDFDDGKMVKIKGGWTSVKDELFSSIINDGKDRFILNDPVERVMYNSHRGCKTEIKLKSGNIIEANHVIVTFSLGVWKKILEGSFFEPPIEAWRKESICSIGFGVVDKVFLQFEGPFLQEERGLKIIWLKSNETTVGDNFPNWAKYITGFDLVDGAPNVLVAWIGGEGAKMLEEEEENEEEGDEKVKEICVKLLKQFLPDKRVPGLISIRRSKWYSKPYIRGSYSYQSVASDSISMENRENVWKPIRDESGRPKIQFAGEATASNMYATAHGAIVSGWREAKELVSSYKK